MGTARAANLLTVKEVEKAKPADSDYYLRDGAGLFVRVYPSGRRTAVYRFEEDGRTRRIEHPTAIGDGLTLSAARTWLAEQKAHRVAGRDPLAVKLGSLAARRSRPDGAAFAPGTFGALSDEFFERVIRRTFKDPTQFRRILDTDILPKLGNRPIAVLRLVDVQQAMNPIVDRGAKVSANRAFLVAKKVFRYAHTQGHIEFNPVSDITRRDVGGREGERERTLSFPELVEFWRVVGAAPRVTWQVRGALRFLLLTGQRIGETLAARWSDFDLAAGVWTLPAENTKSGRAHVVHFSGLTRNLLQSFPRPAAPDAYVFHAADDPATPAGRRGMTPIQRRSVTRALDRLLTPASATRPAALAIAPFVPHDLRRTVRSRLADLGVQPHVAEKVLNHKLGGVLQIYDRADYMPEREAAMHAWNDKLHALIHDEGKTVA
jgi:integrase